jgi:hypothetical protein
VHGVKEKPPKLSKLKDPGPTTEGDLPNTIKTTDCKAWRQASDEKYMSSALLWTTTQRIW